MLASKLWIYPDYWYVIWRFLQPNYPDLQPELNEWSELIE